MEPQGSLPHVSIPSQINPVHVSPFHVLKIHFHTILPCLRVHGSGVLPSGLQPKRYTHAHAHVFCTAGVWHGRRKVLLFRRHSLRFGNVLVVSCSSDRGAWFRWPIPSTDWRAHCIKLAGIMPRAIHGTTTGTKNRRILCHIWHSGRRYWPRAS
jgi:hypothetical protein